MPYPSYRRILLIPLSFPNRNVLLIRNEVEHSLFVDRPVPPAYWRSMRLPVLFRIHGAIHNSRIALVGGDSRLPVLRSRGHVWFEFIHFCPSASIFLRPS